jgi:hypothetical protein
VLTVASHELAPDTLIYPQYKSAKGQFRSSLKRGSKTAPTMVRAVSSD